MADERRILLPDDGRVEVCERGKTPVLCHVLQAREGELVFRFREKFPPPGSAVEVVFLDPSGLMRFPSTIAAVDERARTAVVVLPARAYEVPKALAPRAVIKVPVALATFGRDEAKLYGEGASARSRLVGWDGLRVITAHPLAAGDRIAVAFNCQATLVRAVGTVASTEASIEAASEETRFVEIVFTQIAGDHQRRLSDWVRAHLVRDAQAVR